MFARMREDIAAVKERDPAATSTLSVLFNYPGLHALWWHRFDHWLWVHKRRGIARWLSGVARFWTGIEIHPGATIGRRFFIDHGMGVVIGETTVIHDDVTLYQGVTLGGTGKERGKRHPTLEDCVVVGVGATVLGGITIGHGSRVGAGAVVVNAVPPNCTVVGVPGRVVVREGARVDMVDLHHEDLPDPVVEMFRCIQHRIDRIDARLTKEEGALAERLPEGNGAADRVHEPSEGTAQPEPSSADVECAASIGVGDDPAEGE
jgi:serine O-acetyltransferase